MNFIRQLKPLRIVLIVCALLTIVLRPEPGTEAVYEGTQLITTLLVPVLAPILFMLLLLDTLMSSIWVTQTQGDEKKRYRNNIIINLCVAILLLYFWIPYISALGK
ncbi:MAG: hypothetical protein P8Y24_12690 [Gammaproteobacteria bacterium]|jgi:hypothetical protein